MGDCKKKATAKATAILGNAENGVKRQAEVVVDPSVGLRKEKSSVNHR